MSFLNSIGNAFTGVGDNIAGNIQDGLDSIAEAFDKGGVAPGMLEAADQLSVGNAHASAFESLGLIPDSAAAKQLTAGLINAVALNPIAIKDFVEFGMEVSKSNAKPKDTKAAKQNDVPRPDVNNVTVRGRGGFAESERPPRSPQEVNAQPNGMALVAEVLKPGGGEPVSAYNSDPESFVSQLPPGATFEDFVAAFMMDVVRDQQKDAMAQMKELRDQSAQKEALMKAKRALEGIEKVGDVGDSILSAMGGPAGQALAAIGGSVEGLTVGQAKGMVEDKLESMNDSRQLMMERLKNTMNRLQQMQQALSNVLNTMHQGSMNVIRNIK